MLKNITIIDLGKGDVKYPLHLNQPTTYAQLFDVALELREFALKGMQEAAKMDEPKIDESTLPVQDVIDVVDTNTNV